MTEVTTDTTDRNDRPVAVGGVGNYVAARSVVSEFLLNKWEYRNTKLQLQIENIKKNIECGHYSDRI